MDIETFKKLNPIICGTQELYPSRSHARRVQGEFLKTHKFILESLSKTQAEVIRLRYGIDDGQLLTLSQIGNKLQISHEAVQQAEQGALTKLRNPNCLKLLLEYTDETFTSTTKHIHSARLIRYDMVRRVDENILRLLRGINIEELPLKLVGATYTKLHDGGIYSCGDLVVYLQTHKNLQDISISSNIYWKLVDGVSGLIISINTESLIQSQSSLKKSESIKNYSDVSIEELGFNSNTISVLKSVGIDAVQDIIDYYNNHERFNHAQTITFGMHAEIGSRLISLNINLAEQSRIDPRNYDQFNVTKLQLGVRLQRKLNDVGINTFKDLVDYYKQNGSFLSIPKLTPKDEVFIINKLVPFGITLEKPQTKEIESSDVIERLEFTVRIYNALKRVGINTVSDLIGYYEAHEGFASINTLGVKGESEIITKLSKLNILEIHPQPKQEKIIRQKQEKNKPETKTVQFEGKIDQSGREYLIERLALKGATYNALKRNGINTVGDLLDYYTANKTFRKIKKFGPAKDADIIDRLNVFAQHLASNIELAR